MKAINKIWVFALGTAVMVSCSDLDTFPESGIVTEDQKKEVVEDNPERLQADINTLSSIFTKLLPNWAGGSATPFHNDFSYPAVCIATDGNGADMVSDNSDYEWFSVAFEYSDRNANYAVPMFTWNFCYKLNKQANDILATIPADTENQTLIYYRGQALVARAFANFTLAQRFQFTYKGNEDKPTVPIVTWDMPAERAGANPRATNAEIYKLIYDDLTQAIADLEGFQRTSKAAADRNVAYGMRARVNLVMNNWGEAATDAEAALSGYTFLSKDDVSAPGFNSANSPSWIWAGIYKAADTPANYRNITWGGHLCSFARGYTTSQGLYKRINSLLYNMIPDTDVRKGWWINASLESPLLDHTLISGAKNILLNISTSDADSLALDEVMEILKYIQSHASVQAPDGTVHDANIIWGTSVKPQLGRRIELVVVATGFDSAAIERAAKPVVPPADVLAAQPREENTVLEPIKPRPVPTLRPMTQVMLGERPTRYKNIEAQLAVPAYRTRKAELIVETSTSRKEVLKEEGDAAAKPPQEKGGSLFD